MDTTNCKNNLHGKYNNVVDHVYCHSNENYIRANAGSLDVMALLKENKQLKAMLLLHLDLIQEQSDQLLAKDKLLANLKDENESLKLQIDKYERNYGSSGGDIIKKSTTNKTFNNTNCKSLQVKKLTEEKKDNFRDFTNVDQQQQQSTKPNVNNKKSVSSTCDDKKIKNSTTSTTTMSTRSRQTPSPPTEGSQQQQSPIESKYKIYDDNSGNCSSIIGQSNGKLISKIILHRVQIPESMIIPKKEHELNNKTTMSEEFKETQHQQQQQQQQAISTNCKVKFQQKSSQQSESSTANSSTSNNLTPMTSEIKPMDIKSENIDIDIKSENITECEDDVPSTSYNISPQKSMSDQKINFNNKMFNQNFQIVGDNKRKCTVLTTRKCYPAREWIDEDIPPEEWSNKEEEEALKADAPMLEIPKWTIKEFSGLYSIECTEDLTDDTFTKRHAKFEHDEKRRKKWDAQRIREQRTIERLKRRHCKDELQEIDNQEFSSFYSKPDAIKFIQITEELPVLAFGECIPRLSSGEFHLPWIQKYMYYQQQQQQQHQNDSNNGNNSNQNSSYVFLKKRQRLQSVSINSLRRKPILTSNSTLTTANSLGTETNNDNFTSTGLKNH